MGFSVVATADLGADRDLVLKGEATEQGLKCGQEKDKEGNPFLLTLGLKCMGLVRREHDRMACLFVRASRGMGAIRWQLHRGQYASKLCSPVVQIGR